MGTTPRSITLMPTDKPQEPNLVSSRSLHHEQPESMAESDADHNPNFRISGKYRKGKESKLDKGQSSSSISRFLNGGRAKQVKLSDVSTSDNVVVVMGPTGTGKSSFINVATGHDLENVGHALQSRTNDINVVKLSFPELTGSDICFVDTPGYDDACRSDVDVFKMISEWLNETYLRDIKLSGLLYFHRISDNRMAGTRLKDLRLFEKLCGEDFKNIVLVTTMWDEVDEDTGASRESELKKEYWNRLISRGSRVARFERDRKSAFTVLQPLIDDLNTRDALLLQKEVTELGLKLRQTTAGKVLHLELENLVSIHQETLSRIRDELKHEDVDEDQLNILMEEYQNVAEKLRLVTEDVEQMKMQIGKHLKRTSAQVLNWGKLITFIRFFKKAKGKRRQGAEGTKEPHSVKHELPQLSAQSSLTVPNHLSSGYDGHPQDCDADALQVEENVVFFDAELSSSSPIVTAAVMNSETRTLTAILQSSQDTGATTDYPGKAHIPSASKPTLLDGALALGQKPIPTFQRSDKPPSSGPDCKVSHDILAAVGTATAITQRSSEWSNPNPASDAGSPGFVSPDSTQSYRRNAQEPVNPEGNRTQVHTLTWAKLIALIRFFGDAKKRRQVSHEVHSLRNTMKHEPTERIIAILGPRGSGKSRFIDSLSGTTRARPGLRAEQEEVVGIEMPNSGKVETLLLDTPGFDGTCPDTDVLTKVKGWLRQRYNGPVKLTGIIFLQSLAENRTHQGWTFKSEPPNSVERCQMLCRSISQVILVTSFWDVVRKRGLDLAEKREEELHKGLWAEMIQRGARVGRFDDTPASSEKIIEQLLNP